MNFLDIGQVSGSTVDVLRTNPAHIPGLLHGEQEDSDVSTSFGDMVLDALNGVNDLAEESTALTEQYITNPDSVDVHDITIAMSKANLAITMTKSVVDNALKAYREIINIR
ncbi:MAG: flagellar hook-basal body complex protein FliE [Spirochaetes bacterium]|nr:MAG: flagellar hook-basal body complex protein FliE [Spirochaetota bacterium]